MVRADHARLLRDSAVALKSGPERFVTRQGRAHQTWIGVAEREKLEEAYRRHVEASNNGA
jgi:hypothetical protein